MSYSASVWERPLIFPSLQTWPHGIQDFKLKNDNQIKVKLKGTPWYVLDSPQVGQGKMLLMAVMDHMEVAGYEYVESVNPTMGVDAQDSKYSDLTTFYSVWWGNETNANVGSSSCNDDLCHQAIEVRASQCRRLVCQ